MTQILIQHGANLDAQSRFGETVLHMAVRKGNPMMVRELMQSGATANIQNEDGYTPLDLAVGGKMKSELKAGSRQRVK